MKEYLELNSGEKMIFAHAASKKIPVYGGFELTPYCNLACKMCYIQENKPDFKIFSGAQWLDFGNQAANTGTLYIVLTGGEPLLHPDFKQIYSGLKKLGIILTINTNATLIDEDMADYLATDIPRRVNVSLYGSNADIYQKLCGNGYAFNKTINAIELMIARKIPVKINIVPNIINFPCLDEMLMICKEYDLDVEMTTYLFEPIRKSESCKQHYRLSPEQMAEAHVKWDQYRFTEQEMATRSVFCYKGLKNFVKSPPNDDYVPLRCHAGQSSFWLCWDGKMNPCVNMIQPKADVSILGFKNAWEVVKNYGVNIKVPSHCDTCSLKGFCLTCAAISYHQYGDFKKIPDIMCSATYCYAQKLAKSIQEI